MLLKSPKKLSFWERTYIVEILKGLGVTISHLLKSFWNMNGRPTVPYPDVKRKAPVRFRGRHRLMRREDGSPRCVACMCCPSACPADCIYIVAGEHPDPKIEKYPVSFEIDILRCVFCGLCVEACPVDAIRMDTGIYEMSDYTRRDLIYDKEFLLKGEGAKI